MRVSVLLCFLRALSCLPSYLNDWQAPTDSDSRGPCPGLNTMANYGLINRDGRNIKAPDIIAAQVKLFGMPDMWNGLAVPVTARAVTAGIMDNSTGVPTFPQLVDLGRHPAVGENPPRLMEHDCSITHIDGDVGDPIPVSIPLVDQLLAKAEGEDMITEEHVYAQLRDQVNFSLTKNPHFFWTGVPQSQGIEVNLLLAIFAPDDNSTKGSKYAIEMFLKENKVPENVTRPGERNSTLSWLAFVGRMQTSTMRMDQIYNELTADAATTTATAPIATTTADAATTPPPTSSAAPFYIFPAVVSSVLYSLVV